MSNTVELKNLFKELNFKITAVEGSHCIVKNEELSLTITLKKTAESISKEMYDKVYKTLFLASYIYEEKMTDLSIPSSMKPLISKSYKDLAKGTATIIPDDIKLTEKISDEKSASKYVKSLRNKIMSEDCSL